MYAALGVWADLSPFREAGFEVGLHDGLVPGVATLDAFLLPDRARMGLVVTPVQGTAADDPFVEEDAEPVIVEVADPDGPPGESIAEMLDPGITRFNLVLPTTAVALALSLTTVPIGFRVALIDAVPPEDPEFTMLTPEDLGVIVLIDARIVHDALCGQVPTQLHYPIPYPSEDDDDLVSTPVDSMRALLWSMTSGVALGQRPSFQRLKDFGLWAHASASADRPDTERISAIIENAETVQMLSMDAVASEQATVNLDSLPAAMADLKPLVDEHVEVMALMALADGVPFSRVSTDHGLHRALPALGVLIAARAQVLVDEYADGTTASWLVGTWFGGEDEDPLWAFPSSAAALAYHDVDVMADLLFTQPEGFTSEDSGPLLRRYVHMLTEAVLTMDMQAEDLESGLENLDVKPGNFGDVTHLANSLMQEGLAVIGSAEDGAQFCVGCEVAAAAMSSWEPKRLARAAAALLPCLADLDAVESGFDVGAAEWVAYRKEFLDRWLHVAA